MQLYKIIITFCFALILTEAHLTYTKILSPQSHHEQLTQKSNEELMTAYRIYRKELTQAPQELPSGIEADIAWAEKPEYKREMFINIIEEITRRCTQAKDIENLARTADLFFNCSENPTPTPQRLSGKTNQIDRPKQMHKGLIKNAGS